MAPGRIESGAIAPKLSLGGEGGSRDGHGQSVGAGARFLDNARCRATASEGSQLHNFGAVASVRQQNLC